MCGVDVMFHATLNFSGGEDQTIVLMITLTLADPAPYIQIVISTVSPQDVRKVIPTRMSELSIDKAGF